MPLPGANEMRIGVDARPFSRPVSGVGRYAIELSRELMLLNDDCRFYTSCPPIAADWSWTSGNLRAGNASTRLGRMLWAQTALPLWAARDTVDVFWGTWHRIPRFLPSNIARVVTIHDLVWMHAGETMTAVNRWLEKQLMPEAIGMADRILAVSHSTADAIALAFPAAAEKVRVVYLGPPAMAVPQGHDALLSLGIDRSYWLFVGTLEPRKNLRRLLQAYASLPEAVRQKFLCVIAGGAGWGGVDVHQLVQEFSLEPHVRLVGRPDDTLLASLYAHARFLAMPSLYEGFGLPVVEAMSVGVPALTSNVSSLPEVVGDAGVLVSPLDVNSIAQGLTRLLMDDELHQSLSVRARVQASRFSWKKAAKETLQVFEEAKLVRAGATLT